MLRKILLMVFLIVAGLFHDTAFCRADCTRDQAFNKMMALGQHQPKMMGQAQSLPSGSAESKIAYKRAGDFASRLSAVGAILQKEDYNQACLLYDALAKDYGLDISPGASSALTMDELRKDGGKAGGECDLTETAKRMAALTQKFEEKYKAGKMSQDQVKQFSADTSQVGSVMASNPSQACRLMGEMGKKYGFE